MAGKKTVKCSECSETCKYACYMSMGAKGIPKFVSCDYILHTSQRRGCSPEACDKYEKKES